MKNRFFSSSFMFVLGVLFFISGSAMLFADELRYEKEQDEIYCEMVHLYEIDEQDGVSELFRRGWPDYKGYKKEKCDEY